MKAKYTLLTVLVLVTISILFNVELINYLWMQGKGQFEVLWHSEPIQTYLDDSAVDAKYKQKVYLVDSIKLFGTDHLGLTSEGLYISIYDQQDKTILWSLSACEPYSLTSVEWSFPIVGRVSYKGYFDLEKGKQAQTNLKERGYDTRLRPVNAWSTLGWFSDPILSNMLKRSHGSLAELFLHEITHSNVFIEDSLSFNENLASFIGEQGAQLFLKTNYGDSSDFYLDYMASEHDADLFTTHCLKGLKGLKKLYGSYDDESKEASKLSSKTAYMKMWVSQLRTLPVIRQGRYDSVFNKTLPNNAFFMAFERYSSKKLFFLKQMNEEFDGDLAKFIKYYKEANN